MLYKVTTANAGYLLQLAPTSARGLDFVGGLGSWLTYSRTQTLGEELESEPARMVHLRPQSHHSQATPSVEVRNEGTNLNIRSLGGKLPVDQPWGLEVISNPRVTALLL